MKKSIAMGKVTEAFEKIESAQWDLIPHILLRSYGIFQYPDFASSPVSLSPGFGRPTAPVQDIMDDMLEL
jgi:hypothetical protein